MSLVVKYIVVPFSSVKGNFRQGEMRTASSEESAVRMAELMAERFAGVVAFEVYVDLENGEMHNPRELAVFGRAPDLAEAMAA